MQAAQQRFHGYMVLQEDPTVHAICTAIDFESGSVQSALHGQSIDRLISLAEAMKLSHWQIKLKTEVLLHAYHGLQSESVFPSFRQPAHVKINLHFIVDFTSSGTRDGNPSFRFSGRALWFYTFDCYHFLSTFRRGNVESHVNTLPLLTASPLR